VLEARETKKPVQTFNRVVSGGVEAVDDVVGEGGGGLVVRACSEERTKGNDHLVPGIHAQHVGGGTGDRPPRAHRDVGSGVSRGSLKGIEGQLRRSLLKLIAIGFGNFTDISFQKLLIGLEEELEGTDGVNLDQ